MGQKVRQKKQNTHNFSDFMRQAKSTKTTVAPAVIANATDINLMSSKKENIFFDFMLRIEPCSRE